MDEPPLSCLIASFDRDSLAEPPLYFEAPFQIKVKVGKYMITHCIVDEGGSVSTLSTCAWRGMESPILVLTTSQLLAFDRRTSISLGISAQTPVTLGGNTFFVDFMVIEDPLDFNMILGSDYVYPMKHVVSTVFRVICFPCNERTVAINQLSFLDPPPHPTIEQVFPSLIPNVLVDTTPP